MSEYRRAKATDSSFHRYVERGLLAADRGGDARDIQGSFGEWNGGHGARCAFAHPTIRRGAQWKTRKRRAAATSRFFSPGDLPDGQLSRIPVQSLRKKYFAFSETQISRNVRAIPHPRRGAYRDRHGRWEWDAVDAAVSRDERY